MNNTLKLKALFVALVMVCVPLARTINAQTTDAEKTAKVKAEVAKRVANKKTKVKVKLRNGDEIKGRIEQAGDEGFTIVEDKTGKKTEFVYTDVNKVSGRGGLSKGAKIAIAAGVAVGVLAIIAIIAIRDFDPFEGGLRLP